LLSTFVRHCHLFIVTDLSSRSVSTVHSSFLITIALFGLEVFLGIVIAGHRIFKWQPVSLVLSSIWYVGMRLLICEHEYQLFREWKRAKEPLEALPIANAVDLSRQDCCIVCRQQMTPTHSRRLPCHHCIDLLCLMEWTKVRCRCPICQADLSGLLRSPDPYLHKFEFPRSMYRWVVSRGDAAPMVALRKLLERVEALLAERRFLARQTGALADAGEIADNTKFLAMCDAILAEYWGALQLLEQMEAVGN
jgi:hypothetical protein